MFRNAVTSFKPASQNILGNKVNILLAIIPIVFGILIYFFLGAWVYGSVMDYGKQLIEQYITTDSVGSFVYYFVAAIFTVMLYFLINWTFVLIISIIASPFNDMLSRRIEKTIKGQELDSLAESFTKIGGSFFLTIFNELKKVSFIIILSLVSLVFGYIPLLTPVSILITVLLLSIEFIDFSWSRHHLSFSSCFADLRRNIIGYSFGGGFFFILISIPVVNLIVSPLATSYFTVLWIRNNEHRN